MQLTTHWHEEGRHEGVAAIVRRQLRRRVGDLPAPLAAQIESLSVERLEQLAEDLLDFSGQADLEKWLSRSV